MLAGYDYGEFFDRVNDTINFVDLMPGDIELLFQYTDEALGDGTFYRSGEIAIRIIGSGETLYLGELSLFHDGTQEVGAEGGAHWNGVQLWIEDDENPPPVPVEYDAFVFADGIRRNFYDLFDFVNVASTTLPTETRAAADLLSRIGSGAGAGVVAGSGGDDQLDGTSADEDLLAGDGNDLVDGAGGNDYLRGGGGNDVLTGGTGNDNLHGGGGWDSVSYASASTGVTVDLSIKTAQDTSAAGLDILSEIEGLIGSDFGDSLIGDSGGNDLSGGAGNDTISGGEGWDYLQGGDGADHLYGEEDGDSLFGDSGSDLLFGGAGSDYVYGGDGEDQLHGEDGDDSLYAEADDDLLLGGTGADYLDGGDGDDRITGGDGSDTLVGGMGSDTFVFDAALIEFENVDYFGDFNVDDDLIELSQAVFTAAGTTGTLAASAFQLGDVADDAQDRIIYDPLTGMLFYDADGSGSGAQILFAQLEAGLALTNADFIVGP